MTTLPWTTTPLAPSVVQLTDGRLIDASRPIGRRIFDHVVATTITRLERQARVAREWASYR